jgi:hypothetical protein
MNWMGLLVLLGLGWAQAPTEAQVLNRCQRIFDDIRPLLAYTEEVPGRGQLIRIVLGRPGQWLVRLTLDATGDLVPMGLEEFVPTLPQVRPLVMENQLRRRLARLFQDIALASWTTADDQGFRCVVVNNGRWVGLIRLNRNLRPMVSPEWTATAKLARLHWPLTGIPTAEPQKPNP